MRLLLTGKNGQVGFELQRALAVLGDVVATDTKDCDLKDEHMVRRVIREVRPDVIVNPAAYTAVDKAEAEKSLAYLINARAPRIIAEEAESLGALLVHYSTDYVFDGTKRGAYTELDKPNPRNVYGSTKLAGEQAISESCTRYVIIRTSWVVGAHGNNFPKTILRLASERDSLRVVADQIGAPTSAALLADLTSHMIRQVLRVPDHFPFGIYNAAARGETSWYAYACYVIDRAREAGKALRIAPDAVKPISSKDYSAIAERPANSRLDTQLLRDTFDLHIPDWKVSVDHILKQII